MLKLKRNMWRVNVDYDSDIWSIEVLLFYYIKQKIMVLKIL